MVRRFHFSDGESDNLRGARLAQVLSPMHVGKESKFVR
jgi:hypothetical protein